MSGYGKITFYHHPSKGCLGQLIKFKKTSMMNKKIFGWGAGSPPGSLTSCEGENEQQFN